MDYGPGDVRFFDRLARLYDVVMPRARSNQLHAALAQAERPVDRLLDVGGGPGRAAAVLDAPQRVVVDVSRGMLQVARRRGLGVVQGDAGRLPVPDGSVDAVTIVDALHHMPEQGRALDEAWRALAPGGVLVVVEFDPGTLLGSGVVLGERLIGFGSTFHGPDDLARHLDDVGFRTTVVDRGFVYTLAAVKPGDQ